MSVDNSIKIADLISFGEDDFYFVQVLKRRKDNPTMEKDMVVIKNYYIESMDQYYKVIPRIIELCEYENARAYFRLNKRNYKKLGLQMIKRTADYIASNNNRSLKNVFDSVAGEFHSDEDKKWLVDVDNLTFQGIGEREWVEEMFELIEELQKETGKEPLMEILRTKNGIHLITRPFNLKKFRESYSKTPDIHKDNPTILYCP